MSEHELFGIKAKTTMKRYPKYPILVFTGRPNAGKSSLAKKLFNVKLRTGKKPGVTKTLIVLPHPTEPFLIMDLPGWGFVYGKGKEYEEELKDKIIEFFETYAHRIFLVLHVIDVTTIIDVTTRLEQKNIIGFDEDFTFFAKELKLNRTIIAAKIDKLKKIHQKSTINFIRERLADEKTLILESSIKDQKALMMIKKHIMNVYTAYKQSHATRKR